MLKHHLQLSTIGILISGLVACASTAETGSPQPSTSVPTAVPNASTETTQSSDLTPLFSHIWQVASDPSQPQFSSIYIFLPNGTLLETSCTETYRIATWTVEKDSPRVLQVVEDGELAFTAKIDELTNTTLRLQKNLVRSSEMQEMVLSAVEQEFVCPDLPK